MHVKDQNKLVPQFGWLFPIKVQVVQIVKAENEHPHACLSFDHITVQLDMQESKNWFSCSQFISPKVLFRQRTSFNNIDIE